MPFQKKPRSMKQETSKKVKQPNRKPGRVRMLNEAMPGRRRGHPPKKVVVAPTPKKTRRGAAQMLESLKQERAKTVAYYEGRLAKVDQRIKDLTNRHQDRIDIERIAGSKLPSEIEQDIEMVTRHLQRLRKALKLSRQRTGSFF